MLPMIGRWSDAKVMDEAADRIARLALMAADGQTHGNPYYAFNPSIGYPTRRNTDGLVRTALAPVDDAHPLTSGRGFGLEQLFAEAWERVDADEGDDEAAKALLVDFYGRVLPEGEVWEGTHAQLERAVSLLASSDEGSLWTLAVQAAYPEHPQTPGSQKWNDAEAEGNPHESVANPWTR